MIAGFGESDPKINSSTLITRVRILSKTLYPDIQKSGYRVSGFRIMSGYRSSQDIEYPDIEASRHDSISKQKSSDIEAVQILIHSDIKKCLLML